MFICCILAGFLSGFFFDVCRALRKSFKLKKVMPLVDAVFWVSVVCINYMLLYKSGDGQLRGFCIMGTTGGVIVYMMCFSSVLGKWMFFSFEAVRKILSTVFTPVLRFFKWINSKSIVIVQNLQKNKKNFGKKTLEKF